MTDTTIRTFDHTASALAFPLGGIGTGNVSLGARGELRDWEIFNQPAKGNDLPNTFFMLRAQIAGHAPIMRVLEGPVQPPHTLSHGYHPRSTAGLPRLDGTRFRGEYPFATIDFDAPDLPVRIQLEAFTPLIPLNPEDSGIPCAIFTFTLTNTRDQPVDLTLVGTLANPIGITYDQYGNALPSAHGRTFNTFRAEDDLRGLHLYVEDLDTNEMQYGNLSLVTDHADVTAKPAWLRGHWFDFLQDFWDDLADDGRLDDLGYESPAESIDVGSLGLIDTLDPGASQTYRFVLTWHFPNRPNSWNRPTDPDVPGIIRNHYATRFSDAWDVARYVVREMPRLDAGTRAFHKALFSSTLPVAVIDAVSANIVPVRSTTCFWLDDGRFFGWEGCFDDGGCCAGSCTHVWSYAFTVAYLFPSLEREMRRIEFAVETDPDGYMAFRTFRTFDPDHVWEFFGQRAPAAVDGQMGSILRAYREWQLCGDRDWLANIWPGIKRAIDYASAHWDTDNDGVLDAIQHNTYDIEFHGPNPLCGIYYLAGLRAVEELARIMDEPDLAARCRELFARGSRNLDAMLWNGRCYMQPQDDINAHKYQHGKGCLSDQLLGQLHARILGLGDLLPAGHVRAAIKSVFDLNFRADFRDHVNCQRSFVLNDDAGLLMCSWPEGERPDFPFVYSDEVWTGTEYQVAAHLIYEGWLDAGLTLVQAVRDRHDGIRRNPWNEVECGNHYARSMASWALLLAINGQRGSVDRQTLTFEPVIAASPDATRFRTFWSNGIAWGTLTLTRASAGEAWQSDIEVLGGDLNDTVISIHAPQ